MSWATGYGFNFRNSEAFVTDGANEIWYRQNGVTDDYEYPKEKITGVVAGFTAFGTDAAQVDVDDTRDRRLAGYVQFSNSTGPAIFRVDLPAPGTYEIGLAISSNISATRVEVIDNATSLLTLTPTISSNVADAAGALHSFADWPANHDTVELTFASTILNLRIGNDSGSNSTRLHHLFVRQVGAPSGPSAAVKAHYRRTQLSMEP